MSKMP